MEIKAGDMLYSSLLGIMVLIYIGSAGAALGLIPLTRTRLAWIVVSLSFIFMAVLGIVGMVQYSFRQPSPEMRLVIPAGLAVSAICLTGILTLYGPLAASRRAAEAHQILSEDSLQGLVIFQSGRIVFANRAFAQLSGFSTEELLRFEENQINALFQLEESEPALIYLHTFPQDLSDIRQEQRLISQDGAVAWVEMFIRPTIYQGSAAVQAAFININERRRYQQALFESEQRHRMISAMISDYVYAARIRADRSAHTEWVSGAFERITGRTMVQIQEAQTGSSSEWGWGSMVHPEDRHIFWRAYQKALSQNESIAEYRIYTPEGRVVWLRDYMQLIQPESGSEVKRLLGAVQDISAQKQAEQALRSSEVRWRSLVENAPAIITTVNVNGVVLSVNRSGGHGLPGLTVGHCLYDSFPPSEDLKLRAMVDTVFRSGHPDEVETRHVGFDGEVRWFQHHIGPIRDEEAIESAILLSTDITERKHAEEKLRFFSTHDALTGLYNRAFFEGEVERFQTSRQFPISIVVADVNGLKQTNDLFGHASGDDLLRAVAHVLRDSFRDEDVISRLGGDEFAVILAKSDSDAAQAAIERMRTRIKDYNAGQNPFPLSIAAGAATAQIGEDLIETTKLADDRMYADKTRQKLAQRI